MTNQSLRSLALSLAALALVAGPAWSARVVQVRVGNHPTFTRVVFELDAKAGYAIERREVDGGQELVVTLSAASVPRKLSSGSAMVAGVEVEPSGKDAVARVRLRRAAPLVKELILASPPRIVLDFMLPDDLARAAAVRKPKPAPPTAGASPKTPAEPASEEPLAVADAIAAARPEASKPGAQVPAPKTPAAPAATAKPPETAQAAKPPEPVAVPPKAPEQKAAERAEPPDREQQAVAAPPATPPIPTPAARIETALEGERVVVPNPTTPEVAAGTAEAAPAPSVKPLPPVAKPPEVAPPKPLAKAPAAPAPAAAKPGSALAEPGRASPFGFRLDHTDPWLTLSLVAAGALLFLVVVALLLRKHSRPTSLDALEIARESLGAEDSFAAGTTSGGGVGLGTQRDAFPTAGPGLFDDETEKGDLEMAAQLPIEREARGRMPQTPIGADSDPGPLVRDLERRMTQLESRLDQVNEARERLERQVTAQSEELRVQRAAIARTQRALRGMTRGGEDQATEPALRDPSKPPAGRS